MEALGKKKEEPPEIDERTAFWLHAFSILERGRPYTTGSPLPLHPLDVLDMAERLRWPVISDEVLGVTQSMDDAVLEHMRKK